MSEPLHPRGSGIDIVPELLLRQLIMQELRLLAADTPRIDEMFARVDDLFGGSQDEWAKDMRASTRRLILNDGLRVAVGYPMEVATLPWVSIVMDSGGESGDNAMGDVLATAWKQIGAPSADDPTASRSVEYKTIGAGWMTTLQVGSWSRAPEESVLIHAIVREAMFRSKGRLAAAGVTEISLNESGFEPKGSPLYPDIGFVPVIRTTLQWVWRTTLRTDPVPTRVTAKPGKFSSG